MVLPAEWRGRTNITKTLGSISVLHMVMPTEWRGRTNITKKLGSIEPVRIKKVQQIGNKRKNKYSNNLLYFILFYFILFYFILLYSILFYFILFF